MSNPVTFVKEQYFDGSLKEASKYFGVSPPAYSKWEEQGEFPAKSGRMHQAYLLTGMSYKQLAPSIFKLPNNQAA